MPALIMTEHRLRHLPVIDKGKLIGLISIGDLIKDVVSEQKFTIQQLQHYISGDRGRVPLSGEDPKTNGPLVSRFDIKIAI